MRIKRIIQSGLGLAMVAMVSVQAVAFMNTVEPSDDASQTLDYVYLVDSIAEQLKSEAFDCGEMLTRIDAALDQIDESLDTGVVNEDSLLVARETLVSMRLELPCLSDQLAQSPCCQPEIAPTNIISDGLVGEPVFDGGFVSGGAGGAGGGMGGGGAVGGAGGLSRLLRIGGLTGGIIAAATSGDDDPAPQTSM